ncbi:MAG: restriction endonuclease subunit S [Peptococcaceae bacterium]
MGLTKYAFGELIELCFIRNSDGKYKEDSTIGVNIDKEIRVMKGDTASKDLKTFYIVKPDFFVYNPRGSRKLGLGYNDSNITYITTFNNMIFRIKDEARKIVLPKYLFMYLSRQEWDRKAEFLSWGSSTEVFSWDTFCETTILLPSVSVQQKYVNVYNAMLANQQTYEIGLEDLKLTCDAYIERLRREMPQTAIGEYIRQSDERNGIGLGAESVRGLAVSKAMIETKADMNGVSLGNYKVVPPKYIAYVPDTSRRGDKMSLGFNGSDETYLVSSISTVFGTETERLLPEYLMLFFIRSEFDRYTRFHSWGSARETFGWDDMREVKIPIPDVDVQQSIVNIYNSYLTRREINEKMKAQIKDICPILIKGSLEAVGA